MRLYKEEAYPVFSLDEEDGAMPNVDIGDYLGVSGLAEWNKVEREYREWQVLFAEIYELFSVPAESV